MKLVSVIVPVYNIENEIKRTLKSILNSVYRNIEVIVVNDGSTDNSLKICEEIRKIDDRVTIINQINKGVSVARNAGIEYATGKYLMFVDGDDIISPYLIENLVTNIADCDMVVSGIKRVKGDNIYFENNDGGTDILTQIQAFKILPQNDKISFSACAKLFRKNLLNGCYFDLKTGILEDYLFVCNYLKRCKTIKIINQDMYFYIQRNNSALNSKYTSKRLEGVYSYKQSLQIIGEVSMNLIPYYICNYKIYMIELLSLISFNNDYVEDIDFLKKELSRLKGKKIKGKLRKKIKCFLYDFSPYMFLKILGIYRKIIYGDK